LSKQTVGLVSMLSLMVVLSAYYIVTGPIKPISRISKGNDVEVDIKPVGKATAKKDLNDMNTNNEYFVGYQLQRSALRSKMSEEYMKVLTDPQASKEDVRQAQAKIDDLLKIDRKETTLEDMIRKEGFNDAVVITNNPHIDVIVQSPNLTKSQAVKLITLVQQQLGVKPVNISVSYHP